MYNFDEIVHRKGTDCIKWDQLQKKYGDSSILPFWIADMDFFVPKAIVSGIKNRASHPTYGYSFASDKYYSNFIGWNERRNGLPIKREEIISVPGIVCAYSFIIYGLIGSKGKIMFNTPIYDPFFKVTEEHGCEVVTSSLKKKDGIYQIDWEDIEKKFKDGVDLFVLCNPHNPTGRVWTYEELERLGNLCIKYKVPIFSDDIHSDLVFEGNKYIPIISISEEIKQNTIMAMAPSKTFNLAGLKSSYLIISNEDLRQKISTAIEKFHVGVNLFGLKSSEIAYEFGEEWLEELCSYLKKNAEFVVDYCEKRLPRVKAYVPEGTYLMWLDFSDYELSQNELMRKLVEDSGVALNDGSNYGKEGEGFVRLNIATPKAMLKKGLDLISKIFN
ncbi:MAG: MalY/PatB family protein [Miniphocaeibacter sp.]|uniref:MalY/PatB family protein n=1 Tax=Miniphocaeibacter sp. TaxID=3100973 RepID=UPI0017A82DDA|nr:pyridoxal phosphate-dependent aminotransferase [Gallicola sp.]